MPRPITTLSFGRGKLPAGNFPGCQPTTCLGEEVHDG